MNALQDMRKDVVALARRLSERGAVKVILFGSLANSKRQPGVDSDVDLVVVMPGVEQQPFHQRLADLPEVANFPHPLDLLVYSPDEWERVSRRSFFRHEVLGKGIALFERN